MKTLLIILTLATTIAAQQQQPSAGPQTKIETFQAKTGAVVIKNQVVRNVDRLSELMELTKRRRAAALQKPVDL